uniref:EGF-like domain-containing protein n=1 Tax=Panagrellus redivivus TaxID=6233 RepID=A0A7E4V6B3_PANRE
MFQLAKMRLRKALSRFCVLVALIGVANASPCDITGEAAVLRCASDLVITEFGPASTEPASQPFPTLSFRALNPICEKYDAFKQCTAFVDDQCRSSMLTNLMSLWNFVCEDGFRRNVNENAACVATADSDEHISKCLSEAAEDSESTSRNGTYSIAQQREQRCAYAKAQLMCYADHHKYMKTCLNTVELHHRLLSFVVGNVSDLSSCELPEFNALVKKFTVAEREASRGGCDSSGVCKCVSGFKIDNSTKKCIDIDECAEGLHNCTQKCVNTDGGYNCACEEGFYSLAPDNVTCVRTDKTPMWIYFAHGQSIWNLSESGSDFQLVRMGLQKTAMIDVDIKEHKLYYADIGANVIERKNIDGAFPQPIQTYEVDGVEGIAVDWIGRNLYTSRKTSIIVQTLDGKYRKTLYHNKLTQPRALVANPADGMIYGTDWSSSPFVFRAAMDGSKFEKIVTDSIVWPNALAIDAPCGKLYWADAFLDTIQSSNLDGSKRKTVIADPDAVPHVFGMAVFDETLYWTDWTFRGIISANKHTGQNMSVIAQTALLPYGIKVYHPSVQPDIPSPCEKLACSQLCLLGPGSDKPLNGTCACSDGFELQADGRTCKSNCSAGHILCGGSDPKCISKRYLCDDVPQCADKADENNCPPRICLPGQFQCHDNKKCLMASSLCDGTSNCEDNSDEKYCDLEKPPTVLKAVKF